MAEVPHKDNLQHTVPVDLGSKREGYREVADMIVQDAAKTDLIKGLRQDLEEAHIDELTMLPNRKAFAENLKRTIERSLHEKTTVGLAVCDAAFLKMWNDVGGDGHSGGDKYLVAITNAMRKTVRPTDLVYRIGGDEFAILMPGIDVPDDQTADEVAQKIAERTEVAVSQILVQDQTLSSNIPAHLNVGVAIYDPAMSVHELYQQADAAMYDSKQQFKKNLPKDIKRQIAQMGDDRDYP